MIPDLGVYGKIYFLVDTGSDTTSVHPSDSTKLRVPFARLGNLASLAGIGGAQAYFTTEALLLFQEEVQTQLYRFHLAIARPSQHNLRLPSLLGQHILRHWRTVHDPTDRILQFTVRSSDGTVML